MSIDRREFLKDMGMVVIGVTALSACTSGKGSNQQSSVPAPTGDGKVAQKKIESTGDTVSLLGYGCMRWPTLPSDNPRNAPLDQDKINALVDYAIAHGINYFDLSPHYGGGQSETATGIALSRYPRESYYIATKMSPYLEEHGEEQKQKSLEAYENSFKYFQTDYIDYYLFHGAGIGGVDQINRHIVDLGLLDYFIDQRSQGRIRHLGFSFHGDQEAFDYLLSLNDKVHWDFVQIQANYVDWRHASGWNLNAEQLYNRLTELGIPVVVMEPLRGSSLAALPDHLSAMLKNVRPQDSDASWSFRFLASHPNIMTVLSGMTEMEHLQENVETFSNLEPMTDSEYDLLENVATLLSEFPLVPCTACRYCMPCPNGVDIPGNFAVYNDCVKDGSIVTGDSDPDYKKKRKVFLKRLDKSLEKSMQSDACTKCQACLPKCPQSIKIPDQLQMITDYVAKIR